MFPEVPPRVEYEITEKARGLGPTMEALTAWWNEYGKSVPTKPSARGQAYERLDRPNNRGGDLLDFHNFAINLWDPVRR